MKDEAFWVMADQATLYTRLKLLPNKESAVVFKGIKSCLKRNDFKPLTLTFDNDKAFSCHEHVKKLFGTPTFFTRPYCSQDKETVENKIGVIRIFFPKKSDLRLITDKQKQIVKRKINNRPIGKFKYL